jgi:phosphate-selective porin OprO/OprP
LLENIGYMSQFDFAFLNRFNITDLYVEFREVPLLGHVRVGRWKLPFYFEAVTSIRNVTFLERGLAFTFAPFRQIGLGFDNATADELTTWAVATYRFPTNQFGAVAGDGGGYSVVERFTHAFPLGPKSDAAAIHVGLDYAFQTTADGLLNYRTPPEIDIGESGGADVPFPTAVPPFVDTGGILEDGTNLFDVEFAGTYGPFHFESNAVWALVNQQDGPQLLFPSVSAYAGWILTGEHRPYLWRTANFGAIEPDRKFCSQGWGAWELAFRWSWINLTDKNIEGGELTDLTAGVNWYWNANVKCQFNYIRAMLDRPPGFDSAANICAVRMQFQF